MENNIAKTSWYQRGLIRFHKYENRFWVYYKKHQNLLNLEWNFLLKATHAGAEIGFRKGFKSPKVFIGIPFLINLWIQLFDRDEWEDYELGIRAHSGSIWFHLFSNPMEWSTRDPWYRNSYSLNFKDFFLGRQKHTTEELGTEEVLIPMPEGAYHAIAKKERITWKRSRWPFAKVRNDVWIDCKEGVPFPGKGENSWDCGMDGVHGAGCEGASVGKAIGHFVGVVLDNRRRYGGRNWQCPSKEELANA